MSDSEISISSDDGGSSSDYVPEPKKQKTAITKAVPKKAAAKPKAPAKPRKVATKSSTPKEKVAEELVISDGEDSSSMADNPEENKTPLAPIFNMKKTNTTTKPKTHKASSSASREKEDSISDNAEEPEDEKPALAPIFGKKAKNGNKTVEETYQKKSQLEHILLRPDTYIGSVELDSQKLWVCSDEPDKLVEREVKIVPGLFKIFDEILVNAADNKIRDPTMTKIKVTIDPENNCISVYNNGRGIPVQIHKEEKIYVPELIFGNLLTSSNYDDAEKKVVGGRNGYGAKLCNIFSTEFIVETGDKEAGKRYYQKFTKNMSVVGQPKITPLGKTEEFTKITFKPDLKLFNMEKLDDDIVGLMKRRVYDMCGTVKGVSVFLNDNKLKLNGFKDYIQMYLKSAVDPENQEASDMKLIYERIGDRWEVGFVASDSGQLQQVSFVNSISTSKGGTHVEHVLGTMLKPIQEALLKKNSKSKVPPGLIKSNIWIFVNCLIDNPSFDSQTKENMTLKASKFGSRFEPTDKFQKEILKSGIIELLVAVAEAKDSKAVNKAFDSNKSGRITGIPKLLDAPQAGSRNSQKCTLILTEGDSAKTMAIAGLSKVNKDYFGVFPLRGKLLNVRDAPSKQIANNEELVSLTKILGLNMKQSYTDTSKLRYGHLMIMTDQDHDGSHIKGLLINFFDHFYPSLLMVEGFMQEFITPIVKASRKNSKNEVLTFFTIPEFEQWRDNPENRASAYITKYYKGLATSDRKEAMEYFGNLKRHNLHFEAIQPEERQLIDLAFSKKKADLRKEWLRQFRPGTFIDQSGESISYTDFINKELIQFSMADNIRSIPSVVDGFKPGQRKIIYGCFLRPDADCKVFQLMGSIAEKTAYHHGEVSLGSTIINLAQDFVGTNNVNLLAPVGQFGSRSKGGKDHGATRYIFTRLKPITRLLFSKDDAPLLNHLYDDTTKVEPEWYVPVVPTLLLNGCEGIGTGWSTSIPNYNPVDVVKNIRRLMNGEDQEPMIPWYLGFTGEILPNGPNRFSNRGCISKKDSSTLEITELPVGVWTENFDKLLDEFCTKGIIDHFDKRHTDLAVHYVIHVSEEAMIKLEQQDLYAKFKLCESISTSNMVCFDQNGRIKRYSSPEEILSEFYDIRLQFYHKRRESMIERLMVEYSKLSNQARFILCVIANEIELRNVPHKDIVKRLTELKFDKFPIKGEESEGDGGFNYLLNMKISSLTRENVAKLEAERDNKQREIDVLRSKTALDLWNTDLDAFLKIWEDTVEENRIAFLESPTIDASNQTKKKRPVKPRPKKGETKKEPLSRSNSSAKPKDSPDSGGSPSTKTEPEGSAGIKTEPKSIPRTGSSTKPKALSRASSATKPKVLSRTSSASKSKAKSFLDDSDDSDDPFAGSLSQRTGKKAPAAAKPTAAKPASDSTTKDKPTAKRKKIQLSESEDDAFEQEIEVPTITEARPRRQTVPKASYVSEIVLSSEEEDDEDEESDFAMESE